ncbi:MAG: universal stress protein [Thiohalophilus sp.]|jgi:nucleotide-binding universal stress UspA family protein
MNSYRRILAPVELDRKGEMTVRRAHAIARSLNAELVVVSPLYHHTGFESDHVPFLTPQQLMQQTAVMMQQRLDDLMLRAGAGDVAARILTGKPVKIIPEFARQWRPDLIVLTEGRNYGLRKMLKLPAMDSTEQQPEWDFLTVQTGPLPILNGLWRWIMKTT